MRTGLFVAGVAVLILGSVLFVVPLVPSTSHFANAGPQCTPSGCKIAWDVYSAGPIVPTFAKLSWTAAGAVRFLALTCTNDVTASALLNANGTSGVYAACHDHTEVANSTGTSGVSSFTIPAGGSVAYTVVTVIGPSPSANVTLTVTQALIGLVGIILGVVLWIAGVVLKSKKKTLSPIAAMP